MGRSMAGRLRAAGYELTVFTRRRETATDLLAAGATWANSPVAVAAASDLVSVMVGYPADVQQVVLGEEGVLAGSRPGMILVDHTTSSPPPRGPAASPASMRPCREATGERGRARSR
jgi:3-hydroxyisobutyrate dehydrogenase